ncbi:MAG: NnrS family protein [Stellaceae bacterium]
MAIYALVTLAACLRVVAPAVGANMLALLWLAGAAWSAAYGLFVVLYFPALAGSRVA